MESFDLYGPLPEGTVVLEASAGTGKTHAIATLAVRYLADGVPIDEIMMITFGRAATAELRERVRERLTRVAAALASDAETDDDLVRHLRDVDEPTLVERRDRLARAVAIFDAATIDTTHGFCRQMLAGLGIAADVDADATFAEDTRDLVTEVVQDLYLRAYGRPDSGKPPFTPKVATGLAQAAVGDPSARIEPRDAEPDSEPDLRRRIAEGARSEVGRRKRRRRLMDFDDLLVHLRDALADPSTGADARARVRSRYRIVLVDEFQDTDPVQWEILAETFHGHHTLVLIGDPKQAIYAFRGADVTTYLTATAEAAETSTLGTNWRSDADLVAAIGAMLGGAALGDPRILVHPVEAAHGGRSLTGGNAVPVRLRVVTTEDVPVGRGKLPPVGRLRPYIAADVASDVVRQLGAGATITDRSGRRHPLAPGDIAVLVHRNADAETVREALDSAGVPAVLTGSTSVFGTDAAQQWLVLLTALEQPHRSGLVHAAALTDFLGWTAEGLATGDEAALDGLSVTVRSWADVLTRRGVAALLERATATGMVAHVLGRVDGERDLTDLRHIGQALHAESRRGTAGATGLVTWLRRRIEEAREEADEELSRRLESDAEAVQVVTIHRSKGLEFPVVYTPFLWDRFVPRTPDPLLLHEDGERVRDVGGQRGPAYGRRRAIHASEDAGESLRLAYVALTRASTQVVAHWAPSSNARAAPLHRLLFAERTVDGVVPESVAVGDDEAVRRRLEALAAESAGRIAVEHAAGGDGGVWAPEPAPAADLSLRSFDRTIDEGWARTSYTRLTAGQHEAVHDARMSSEPEEPGTVDEPDAVEAAEGEAPSDAMPSPMSGLPAGATLGTLVHGLLEQVDFAAPTLRDDLVARADEADASRTVGVPADVLADALLPSLGTPLGPLAHDLRLVDVAQADRRDELDFELPLVGGDAPTGAATIRQVATLLRRHLPEDDPMAGYADDLDVPLLAPRRLRGFLTGSIDLVLRVHDDGPRYLVVDYKTNRLGVDPDLTAEHYRPDRLVHAMREAHYPLQALLYAVALHRFLRWRQRGYDPEVHLGGVLYLFLRGMCGPDTPVMDGVPCGVFSWRPPAALVLALSDLLDRGEA